jgi:hypothetical protein
MVYYWVYHTSQTKKIQVEPCHDADAPKSARLTSQCGGTLLTNLSCAGTPRKVADIWWICEDYTWMLS